MISNWLTKPYRIYLSLGSEIALLLSLPIILGNYIDEYFEVKPFGLISGALVGIILFFFRIFHLLKDPTLDGQGKESGD
ncbi:MAG: hypothetical protein CL672_05645 [Balneola sp.]|nr:hypothetical protein [Balneola sp.]|tara:strand:- start:14682 stop:14918 length:237 start_codon:yes stop_codon:yes gene_type:complete